MFPPLITSPVLNSDVVRTPGSACIVLKRSGSASAGADLNILGDKLTVLGWILFFLLIFSAVTSTSLKETTSSMRTKSNFTDCPSDMSIFCLRILYPT